MQGGELVIKFSNHTHIKKTLRHQTTPPSAVALGILPVSYGHHSILHALLTGSKIRSPLNADTSKRHLHVWRILVVVTPTCWRAAMPAEPPPAIHSLPPPFQNATVFVEGQSRHNIPLDGDTTQAPKLELLTQGAEALVFKTDFLATGSACALKYRPVKHYRHPILDRRLTKARLLAEARVLVRCRREGVRVPGVLGLDWEGK